MSSRTSDASVGIYSPVLVVGSNHGTLYPDTVRSCGMTS